MQTVLGESGQRRRRRTRRRISKARRIARAFEPIAFVVALCVLSMGVIKVAEVAVPTKSDYVDQQRAQQEREQMRSEVRELAQMLEAGWAPSFQEGDDPFLDEFAQLDVGADPMADIEPADIADGVELPPDARFAPLDRTARR